MATLSRIATQYRDGVFSSASPAPRYGSLLTSFEDGSLGSDGDPDADAAQVLNAALDQTIAALQPAGLESRGLPPAALASAATAVALAQQARAEGAIDAKLTIAIAASYAATFFGLPRSTLLFTVEQIFGMFALTAAQRRQFHQDAARLLDAYAASIQKGSSMSGVFKDGVLGGAYHDGVLGRIVPQQRSIRDGVLGAIMNQPGVYRDGALGTSVAHRQQRRRPVSPLRPVGPLPFAALRPLRGVGGGCGCSGVGADEVVAAAETPFYKKPLVIGGAAIALGIVLYAVKRK